MAGVMIDIPGVGNVEAKNAATESTLRELVNLMKGTGGGGGAGGGGGGGKNLKEFNREINNSNKNMKGLGKAGGVAGAGAKLLGAGMKHVGVQAAMVAGKFIDVALNSAKIIENFANVGDSVERAAGIFSGIPVIGPVFSAVASAATKTVDAYQNAATVGATFGGSINNLAAASSAAGMTMEKFAKLVSQNGEAMMLLGGTTEAGAKRFSDLGKAMRNSQVGNELLRMGYSTEQINNGMAQYIKTVGYGGALQGKSAKELAAGAGAYLKELDALSKITGQSREALQKQQEAMLKDAQFRAATAKLDPKARAELMAFIQQFPAESQEAIKDMITSGNITTDAAVEFNAQMGGTAQRVMEIGQQIKSTNKVNKTLLDTAYKDAVAEAKQREKSEEFATLGTYAQGQFAKSTIAVAELASRDIDGKEKALTEQEKLQKNTAEQLEKFKQTLATVSNQFMITLVQSGVLDSLMQVFMTVADLVQRFVVPAFNFIAAVIPKVVHAFDILLRPVVEAISNLFGGSMTSGLQMFDSVINTVVPVLDAYIRGLILAFEGLWDGVKLLFDPLKRLWDTTTEGADVVDMFAEILIRTGDFIGGIFKFLGAIIGGVIDIITDVIGWFKDLVNKSETLTAIFKWASEGIKQGYEFLRMVFSENGAKLLMFSIKDFFTRAIGSFIESMTDWFGELFDKILVMIPNKFGGISEEEKAQRDKVREERKKAREDEAKAASIKKDELIKAAKTEVAAREAKVQKHIADVKQGRKELEQRHSHIKKFGDLAQKEEEKREEQIQKTYDDPIELLKQQAKQQMSGLIPPEQRAELKTPQTATVSQVDAAKKNIEKQAEDKAEAERKVREANRPANSSPTPNGSPGNTRSSPTPNSSPSNTPVQETPTTLLAQLNTKMDQLIKINKGLHDVNERQLSVQQSYSNDLYVGVSA